MLRVFFFACFFQIGFASAQTCTMSGTYKVGPGGNYTTLALASAALRTNGMSGAVILELKTNYTPSSEININFGGIACISAARTLTIRPEAGAANLEVSNITNSGPLISLANARYVTIDGRPGGTGNTIALTIANYSVSGYVFLFSTDASYNTLKYLNIKGATSSQTSGLINFMGTGLSITNGNNDNLITNCNFGNTGQYPANCIYSVGSTGKKNARNRVVNCNIKDFGVTVTSGVACGILLGANNSAWEITGNSFYQTAPAYASGTYTVAININDISSTGFLINNNFIGGTAPMCGGAPFFLSGGLRGIMMSTGTAGYSDIQGNTIQNIEWTGYLNPADFCAILLLNGKLRCGTTDGNIIGSSIQNGSIKINESTYQSPYVCGIRAGTGDAIDIFDTVLIKNNIISGIKVNPLSNGGGSSTSIKMYGIYIQRQASGFINVSNNVIGSLTMENSLENLVSGPLKGIFTETSSYNTFNCSDAIKNIISGNTISNLNGGFPRGIDIVGGRILVQNNLVQRLANVATYNFPTIGISTTYNCPGTSIIGNTVRNLKGHCTGIFSDNSNGIDFDGNFIHSFWGPTAFAYIKGIHIYATTPNPPSGYLHGNFKIRNNMIRFGIDSTGNPLTENFNMRGIETPLDSTVITHNSVFLGGSDTFNAFNSNIHINRLMGSGNRITNNILMNENSTPAFYTQPPALLSFTEEITSLPGLFIDNNLYKESSESYAVIYKNIRYRGLALWRIASGMDANSIIANPNFINANGNLNNVNLHLNSPTPAEGKGILEPDVALDFDMETRAGLTATDIGADAGNYTQASTVNAPFGLLCPGGNISFNTDVSSQFSWYQWQVDTGAGFIDINDNSYYLGTTSSTLQITGIPSAWYGYKFRGLVNFVPGTVYSLKFENRWTGAADNSWHNPANWSCGIIPDGNTDVIITNGPVLINANAICRTIFISPGVIFSVGNGVIFTITN